MGKTILVLLDGCRYDAITEAGGFFEHLIDRGIGAKYRVLGELPSISRPCYETLMTGLPVVKHGITNNEGGIPSHSENLFSLCKRNGLKTAAAAYFWISELYCKAPYDPVRDRLSVGGDGSIDFGIYYHEDQYPDSHLFLDAEYLRRTYDPDFLLVHSMNIDLAGHRFGGGSKEYLLAVDGAVEGLSPRILEWMREGYEVVVAADHGMSALGLHGGSTDDQRQTALYLFSPRFSPGRFTEKPLSQLNLAPLLCSLLDIRPAQGMIALSGLQKTGENHEKA